MLKKQGDANAVDVSKLVQEKLKAIEEQNKDTNVRWGRYAHRGPQPQEFMQMLKRRNAL
jgi:hypothetical protein